MFVFGNLEFTDVLLDSFAEMNKSEQKAIVKALESLDSTDRYPTLNVHRLQGNQAGMWTAYATRSIRLIFVRLAQGRRRAFDAAGTTATNLRRRRRQWS